jgi:lactate dehydrogenase-like 2-hydroxyacid dehydrogenase
MAKIAVITPISHLKGVVELLLTKGRIFLYEESTKEEVREMLLTTKADIILCNPNQQTYKIDKELLEDTSVKLINTCSTGMNHIDVDYCKENNIEIYSLTRDMNLIIYLQHQN